MIDHDFLERHAKFPKLWNTYLDKPAKNFEWEIVEDWFERAKGVWLQKVRILNMDGVDLTSKNVVVPRRCFVCADCLDPDYFPIFMVHNPLWKLYAGKEAGSLLCWECFEQRMGRPITREDLKEGPICNQDAEVQQKLKGSYVRFLPPGS